jgi:hypothetical protein
MTQYVINVMALYEDLKVSADSLEEAMEIAKMTIVDRWPDEIIASPKV